METRDKKPSLDIKVGFDILSEMEVVVFIPARFSSTRLEGKPLLDIAGRPMVQWVYEQAVKAELVGDVVVVTDDERILKTVESFGGKARMSSTHHRCGTDRVAEAARCVSADVVVNIQVDEPLVRPEMIDEAIRPLVEDTTAVVSTLKKRITDPEEYYDPNVVKVVTDAEGYALYFSRSPIPYSRMPFDNLSGPFKHIGLYAYRREFLVRFSELESTPLEEMERLEQLRVLERGFKIKVVETRYDSIGVDTPEDLEKVREMMRQRMKAGGGSGNNLV